MSPRKPQNRESKKVGRKPDPIYVAMFESLLIAYEKSALGPHVTIAMESVEDAKNLRSKVCVAVSRYVKRHLPGKYLATRVVGTHVLMTIAEERRRRSA